MFLLDLVFLAPLLEVDPLLCMAVIPNNIVMVDTGG